MELTRRDAMAVLTSTGIVVGAGAAALSQERLDDQRADPDVDVETLVAVAEVLYPSEVGGVREFVETYVAGRTADRPDYRDGMADVLTVVDERAESWFDAPYAALDRADRDATLRQLGADAIEPDPEGRPPARVRYYVVNELLYAFYTSPTGGSLVGTENPIGHPGGTASYRRGADE
ncbi:gluconate 2-dehydrogenase subunit 3 family protein [Haloarchaeobius salinus]|uniref:gluconate 2-dehydrogenase subunit 3 family protein n=1 Tax=Haloarchaeobius salinus TaxID=1198298 RepID=UPI00210A2F46|nr:gluconate 2-dehydrogenase subunit 3 family protein [Haloarchaeobius salinus]